MSGQATPDFSQFARRASERLAIVRYVLGAPRLQETDYLEWKAGYDLSKNSGAVAAAKHLIGFANRDFAQAARHAASYAYLLLGVEPGNLSGVPVWDSADIENWLVRFIGRDLRYDSHYVELRGKNVLFLSVDPPKQGDPIFCLQRTSSDPSGSTMREGTVYVRHGGQTDVASAADIARLAARAGTAASRLALQVELDTSEVALIAETVLSDEARDAYVEQERTGLYSTMPSPGRYGMGHLGLPETRSQDEVKLEVEAYAAALTAHWTAVVVADHIEHERSKLVAVVVNATEHNFEDVVVELTLPIDGRLVYLRPRQAAVRLRRPEAPDGWGQGLMRSLGSVPVVPRLPTEPEPEVEELEKGATLVRFPPLHVRPHTRHRLPRLLLAPFPGLAGTTLTIHWRATARNTPGQLEGDAEFVVPGLDRASATGPQPR